MAPLIMSTPRLTECGPVDMDGVWLGRKTAQYLASGSRCDMSRTSAEELRLFLATNQADYCSHRGDMSHHLG